AIHKGGRGPLGRRIFERSLVAREEVVDRIIGGPAPFAGDDLEAHAEAQQIDHGGAANRVVKVNQTEARVGHRELFQVGVAVQVHGGQGGEDVFEGGAGRSGEAGVREAKVLKGARRDALKQFRTNCEVVVVERPV